MTHRVKHTTDGIWPRGFEEHRRSQVLMGLRLTPAERLRWLEDTMETLRRWQGRAAARSCRGGSPGQPRK